MHFNIRSLPSAPGQILVKGTDDLFHPKDPSVLTPGGSWLPSTDNAYDLGSTAKRWRTLYADTGVQTPAVDTQVAGTLAVGGTEATEVDLGHAGIPVSVKGGLVLSQSMALHAVHLGPGAFPYVALSTDYFLGVQDTTAARQVTLPNATSCPNGQVYIVKDEGGLAGTNNITVKSGGGTLDGVAAATGVAITTNYGVARWITDGTNWFSF